ncbi:CinA family protein [Legionella dresdenensis]|uniref:CinA family protein n=1 Tax=Legionella dresdenensis TaxID=450200 RepID=A0ABV8CG39_9GAMM
MKLAESVIKYLTENQLTLVTAESCTAGQILALLGKYDGCGQCLDLGYVVYSCESKKRVLKVKQETIDCFTLTSEEVAHEMAMGALSRSQANLAIATTGITGSEPMDGIEPGTVCFAWGYQQGKKIIIRKETRLFKGSRKQMQHRAACYALKQLILFHKAIASPH